DRLSRSRAGVHGHRPQPDGPSHRSDRHHHGRLPHDQPRDFRPDEHLQPPCGDRRTIGTPMSTAVDMPQFVRAEPVEALPPPNLTRGPIAWVRENLFSSPFNTLLTL